jgi:phospho-N-acetylmuramoyl-pentapeptide-transferase
VAGILATTLSILGGPAVIGWLQQRFRERVASASPTLDRLHAHKQQTPTLGGLLILGAWLLSLLCCGDLTQSVLLQGGLVAVGFAVVGATDDWIKLRTARRGLSARQKLILQILVAGIVVSWLAAWTGSAGERTLHIPGLNRSVSLGWFWPVWGVLVIVGSSNAVNLTDGLDGLAAGTTVISGTVLALLILIAGGGGSLPNDSGGGSQGTSEALVLLVALLGATLGFLWHNAHPARVFMGDTGALAIGAVLGWGALVSQVELVWCVLGGVFVVETLSVILQIGCWRLLGFRPLRCSPLHNHYVFAGVPETRIVTRFWIAAAVCGLAGLLLALL